MTLRQPSLFFRSMILGAQGVFYNVFCMSFVPFLFFLVLLNTSYLYLVLSYICSPRTCHRFVAYLEEEAVIT